MLESRRTFWSNTGGGRHVVRVCICDNAAIPINSIPCTCAFVLRLPYLERPSMLLRKTIATKSRSRSDSLDDHGPWRVKLLQAILRVPEIYANLT